MTAQHYMADRIIGAAKFLAHFLETTATDKRDWLPELGSAAGLRSPNQMVGECVLVNRLFAKILRGEAVQSFGGINDEIAFIDLADAQQQLISSAEELATVIRGWSDEQLAKDYTLRRGVFSGFDAIEFPYRNMQYHTGQINYVQLLYGDATFHFPKPK
jgi:hypothetical protein